MWNQLEYFIYCLTYLGVYILDKVKSKEVNHVLDDSCPFQYIFLNQNL